MKEHSEGSGYEMERKEMWLSSLLNSRNHHEKFTLQ